MLLTAMMTQILHRRAWGAQELMKGGVQVEMIDLLLQGLAFCRCLPQQRMPRRMQKASGFEALRFSLLEWRLERRQSPVMPSSRLLRIAETRPVALEGLQRVKEIRT